MHQGRRLRKSEWPIGARYLKTDLLLGRGSCHFQDKERACQFTNRIAGYLFG